MTQIAEAAHVDDDTMQDNESVDGADDNESVTTSAKKQRVSLALIIDVDINPARCKSFLKEFASDSVLNAQIKALHVEAKLPTTTDERKLVIAAEDKRLSAGVNRFSDTASVALATIADEIVKEILQYGAHNALLDKKRIITVKHLHSGELATNLKLLPIYAAVPAWANCTEASEKAIATERALKAKAKEAAKLPGAVVAAPVEAFVATAVPSGKTAAPEKAASKMTFYTYVDNALSSVKKISKYADMWASKRVREHLSDVVIQVIELFASYAEVLISETVLDVRTINGNNILATLRMLLRAGKRDDTIYTGLAALVGQKIEKYADHLKTENARRTASTTAEKKQELEAKKVVSSLNKKKQQLLNAEKTQAALDKKKADLALAVSTLTQEAPAATAVIAAAVVAKEAAGAMKAAAKASKEAEALVVPVPLAALPVAITA
jgi:hypothetical protein